MSSTVHHRDGSRTVTFSDGRKARFGVAGRKSKISGTPYLFSRGPKIELPEGVAHGMIFEYRNKTYVAMRCKGKDSLGRNVNINYGQPIALTRPL